MLTKQDFKKLDPWFDKRFDQKFTENIHKFWEDNLEPTFNEINRRFDRLEARFDNLETKVDTLPSKEWFVEHFNAMDAKFYALAEILAHKNILDRRDIKKIASA